MPDELTDQDLMVSGHAITPWHRKGFIREGTLTIDETRELVAPWEPYDEPVFVNHKVKGKDNFIEVPERRAISRPDTGTVLGITSDEYGVFKNLSGFELAGKILDEGDGQVEVETGGTLRAGRYVWVLLWMNRELTVEGDRFDPYLLATWGHDGATALTVANTYVRVVCANTRHAALNSSKRFWRTTHAGGIEQRAKEARHVLRIADEYEADFVKDVEAFLKVRVSDKRFKDVLVPGVFPIPEDASNRARLGREKRREEVIDLWASSDTVAPWRGNGWGAFQAFSTWDEYQRPVRGDRDERRAMRASFGVSKKGSGGKILDAARQLILAK